MRKQHRSKALSPGGERGIKKRSSAAFLFSIPLKRKRIRRRAFLFPPLSPILSPLGERALEQNPKPDTLSSFLILKKTKKYHNPTKC